MWLEWMKEVNHDESQTSRLHADGTLLMAPGQSTVYLMEAGKKRGFVSMKAFVSRGFKIAECEMIDVSELAGIPEGHLIDCPSSHLHADGTLLMAPGQSTLYLMEAGKKRGFVSMEAFVSRSFNISDCEMIDVAVLAGIPEGHPIHSPSSHLNAEMAPGQSTVYLMEGPVPNDAPPTV